MNKDEKILNWLEREKLKDRKETEKIKMEFIKQIKKEKNLFPEPKKLTLWQRVRKVLIGY